MKFDQQHTSERKRFHIFGKNFRIKENCWSWKYTGMTPGGNREMSQNNNGSDCYHARKLETRSNGALL